MWDSSAPSQGGTVSDSMLALRFLAFKERPPGPPSPVLLNKQGWLSADHNHWMSSLRKGTQLRCLLSICFMYVYQFTDLNRAILIITSSLQACSLCCSAISVSARRWVLTFTKLPCPQCNKVTLIGEGSGEDVFETERQS